MQQGQSSPAGTRCLVLLQRCPLGLGAAGPSPEIHGIEGFSELLLSSLVTCLFQDFSRLFGVQLRVEPVVHGSPDDSRFLRPGNDHSDQILQTNLWY